MTECDDLIVHREGGASVIRLNRPKAINAMTLEISIRIDAALDRFEHDPDVAAIALEGAGERGLCAGEDLGARLWRQEYIVNARIAKYPKPMSPLWTVS